MSLILLSKKNEGGYYLNLDEKKWAKIIPKVLQIPKEVLVNNANILSVVFIIRVIDEQYINRIRRFNFK